MNKRAYFKWNINELIALQREYELLELTIQEIAFKHRRSIKAILCRLQEENFIRNWNEAKGYNEYVKDDDLINYFCHDRESGVDSDSDSDSLTSDSDFETSSLGSEKVEESSIEHYNVLQLDQLGLAMSVRKFLKDLTQAVKKFTSVGSDSNLSEM